MPFSLHTVSQCVDALCKSASSPGNYCPHACFANKSTNIFKFRKKDHFEVTIPNVPGIDRVCLGMLCSNAQDCRTTKQTFLYVTINIKYSQMQGQIFFCRFFFCRSRHIDNFIFCHRNLSYLKIKNLKITQILLPTLNLGICFILKHR